MGEFEARMPKRVRSAIEHAERDEIIRVLKGTAGRIGGPNGAAARLGLKRTTLISRMRKLGIRPGYATL
jgi:formate hydrogenlyase transcriptional activator